MRKFLAFALSILFVPLPLPARAKKNQASGDTVRSSGLKLFILEGKGGINFIPDHKGTTPVVEVRDENDLPLENVNVEFRLPQSGPGGQFENGTTVKNSLTNTSGQAQAPFTVNETPGSFSIQVAAKIDTRTGSALIFQANSLKSAEAVIKANKHRWYRDWRVLAIAGGAAALTTVLLVRGSSGSSSSTVVLSPGTPTFGAPH